jgi:hypothetical protein
MLRLGVAGWGCCGFGGATGAADMGWAIGGGCKVESMVASGSATSWAVARPSKAARSDCANSLAVA